MPPYTDTENPQALVRYVRWAFWAVAAVVVAWGLRWVLQFLMPVVASLLIAWILDPLIDYFEARRIPRAAGIMMVVAGVLLGLALLITIVVPVAVQQFHDTSLELPRLYDTLRTHLWTPITQLLGEHAVDIEQAMGTVGAQVQTIGAALLAKLGQGLNSLAMALLVPVFVFYFLRDFDTLKRKPLALVPPRHRAYAVDLARRIDTVVGHWARGQLKVASILALIYAVGLSIAGVRLGWMIGLCAGTLSVVPYVGAISGFVMAMVMVLMNHGGLGGVIGVLVVFLVAQLLEGYVLTPRLVGGAVGLSPVTVIVTLFFFGSIFGFWGLLVAVPATAAAVVVAGDLKRSYERTTFFQGNT